MRKGNISKKLVYLLVVLLCLIPFATPVYAATPTIDAYSNKNSVMPSEPFSITVIFKNANSIKINGVQMRWTPTDQSSTDVHVFTQTKTTTYKCLATNVAGGTAAINVPVYMYPTVSLTISPPNIEVGKSATISWSSTDATSAALTSGSTTLRTSLSGSMSISPTTSTTYVFTATNPVGASNKITAVLNVATPPSPPSPPKPKPTISFSASPTSIVTGDSSTLSWNVKDATSISISNTGISGSSSITGNREVSPTSTTTYVLTATGAGGTSTSSCTVTVTAPQIPAPTISTFTANPTSITRGESSTLSWNVRDATSISIDNNVPAGIALSGTYEVSPTSNTTYTLTAIGSGGTRTATTTIRVDEAPREEQQTTIRLTLSRSSISEPSPIRVSWVASNAQTIAIDNGIYAGSNLTGSKIIDIDRTTTFTAQAFGTENTATASITVTYTGTDAGQDFFSIPILIIVILIVLFIIYYYYRTKKGNPITIKTVSYKFSTTLSKLKHRLRNKPEGPTKQIYGDYYLRRTKMKRTRK